MRKFVAKIFDSILLVIAGAVALVGILCVGIPVLRTAMAAEALPSGGEDFGTAVTIEPGSYVTDHEIAQNSFEYFKVSIKAGQMLKVKVTTPAGEYPYAGVTVYDLEQEEIGSETIIGDALTSETVSWLRSYEDSSIFYIAVGSEYDENAIGTTYAISVNDYYDAGTQTDVGGTHDTALKLTSVGEYRGYVVSQYLGTDLVDFYEIRVEEGKSLTVRATPSEEGYLEVTIYNSDKEELASKVSANEGAIVTVSSPEALNQAGDLFIKVDGSWSGELEEPIDYTLEISTPEGTTTNGDTTSNGDTTADGDTTTNGGAAGGPNWTLIGAGVIGLILTGVLASAFLKKKKQPAPSKADQSGPEQPEQPSEGGTES